MAKRIKTYTLAEMKEGTSVKLEQRKRDDFEYELRMDVLGKMIKAQTEL